MNAVFLAGGKVALMAAAPFMICVAIVGLAVSALQAASGVQDQASAQASRLATGGLVALVCGPWILRTLTAFSHGLWSNLGGYLR
jgi:flagellar biosynthesis protein FliQ